MTISNIEHLKAIEQKLLWLSCQIIHNANNIRDNTDGLKVGGHQASCASIVPIMTALYFTILKPEDRVAVKPHASPVFHAMQYMVGQQSLEKLKDFRSFGGAQSYPSRTKDADDVDFSTGSVGLGVAITAFASLVQDYIAAKEWGQDLELGRMVALVGDAELDEGNIYECLQESWKHNLKNCWWVIDYNRQSLDGIVAEGLYERLESIFHAFGWRVVPIKYGILQRNAFQKPGGEKLREWINNCPNQLYSALTYQGGARWRKQLMDDIGDQGNVSKLIDSYDNDELAMLMENLGGQCLETLIEVFERESSHDYPTVFLAYTTKGWGTPLAGHKDNHAGLMNNEQMLLFQEKMKIKAGKEWDPFYGIKNIAEFKKFLGSVPFFKSRTRNKNDAQYKTTPIKVTAQQNISTQAAFGKIMQSLAEADTELSDRIITTSPDVTVSTNLGAWVNKRNLFAKNIFYDTFKNQKIPSLQKWQFSPEGQHIELGIAEMNLFLLLGAAGLSHRLFGKRLIPIGTVYDTFIARGLDALNYACYQDSRFILVGTPSGVSLAPEGGAHQSIATPLIGISQDGLASFEPAYMDELAVIMEWALDYIQKDPDANIDETKWLRDQTGGSVYVRLSTRSIEQPHSIRDSDSFKQGCIDGGYWWREPGPNCEIILAYQGCVAPEIFAAAARIGEHRRDMGVLAMTSSGRLLAGWNEAQKARRQGVAANSHIETLLSGLPKHCKIITVIDGHPLALGWLGSVYGHETIPLGVSYFGQTGTIPDLYRHFGIDAEAIIDAASRMTSGAQF